MKLDLHYQREKSPNNSACCGVTVPFFFQTVHPPFAWTILHLRYFKKSVGSSLEFLLTSFHWDQFPNSPLLNFRWPSTSRLFPTLLSASNFLIPALELYSLSFDLFILALFLIFRFLVHFGFWEWVVHKFGAALQLSICVNSQFHSWQREIQTKRETARIYSIVAPC